MTAEEDDKERTIRKNVDKMLLKKLDVRVVGMFSACFVKTPKPRPDGSVGGPLSFLSELGKIVPQSDISFHPENKIYLAPREPKPWEV